MKRSDPRYFAGQVIVLLLLLRACDAVAQPLPPVYFDDVVEKRLASATESEWKFERFCPVSTDGVAMRVLQSYGSMFVANEKVKLPWTCILKGEGEALRYQKQLEKKPLEINGIHIALQTAASTSLESAIAEASMNGLQITPLDGAIAGARSYGDTLMLWNSRVFPGMEFWIRRGRLPTEARDELARLELQQKVAKILEWESQGMFFSTDRTRSIFTSTAPPGTSQHIALVAFDVVEYWNLQVRAIMNKHGWFQTVVDDPVHFTYLGFPESELPSRGLLGVFKRGQLYWIPNMPPRPAVGKLLQSSADIDGGQAQRRPQ